MDGDLTLQKVPGGIRILHAPRLTCISLEVLAAACGHAVQVHGDCITIADQVVYQVTAWQASPPGLTVALLEDRRPKTEGER
ncbi:hypothetical protein C6376_39265 [Streptomyces sp. P3]|uniref:hypothetical protein n=1 Tax=unclassified Streptomyces TaxID=2593676 RepID=UPI000D19DBA2|nr:MULTISPECIES: hypothetical protein [unclassified Streptomyces]AVV46456.1 hypothetical protein C6376_38965 [Streptomyces sp. P3]AVV46515.1 hypothetical protein C6376_39265 [Streptomyces sp. P3]